jgi:hypothetical protein
MIRQGEEVEPVAVGLPGQAEQLRPLVDGAVRAEAEDGLPSRHWYRAHVFPPVQEKLSSYYELY